MVTIDKAGRIVVPKELRDALHLDPGTPLRIERLGDRLTLAPAFATARLTIENGTPLIFPADGADSPVLTTEMVNEFIAQGRLERQRQLLGVNADQESE